MSSQGAGTSPRSGHTLCEQRWLFAAFSLHQACDQPGFGAQICKLLSGWLRGGLTPSPGLHAPSRHHYQLSHLLRSLSPTPCPDPPKSVSRTSQGPCCDGGPQAGQPLAEPGPGKPGRCSRVPAQLQRLLAVPEAGCLPRDGGGKLKPSAHCAPKGEQAAAGLGGEGTHHPAQRLASTWGQGNCSHPVHGQRGRDEALTPVHGA